MNTDDRVALAAQLAEQLDDVDQNEWKKWAEYLKRNGDLERGLSLAQQLSRSPMLRRGPQDAYRQIGEVIKRRKSTLSQLPAADLHQVLGFVAWCLKSGQGGSQEKTTRGGIGPRGRTPSRGRPRSGRERG